MRCLPTGIPGKVPAARVSSFQGGGEVNAFTFITQRSVAVFAENLDRQLVMWRPGLCVVELQKFMALGEKNLMLVEEGRPESNYHAVMHDHSACFVHHVNA